MEDELNFFQENAELKGMALDSVYSINAIYQVDQERRSDDLTRLKDIN